MIKSLLTAIAVLCCISAKSQHYQYQFQIEDIQHAGDAKIASNYMTEIFDKQPRYDSDTGLFSVLSDTRILKTAFAEKSLNYGYKLGAFNVTETKRLWTNSKK